MCNSNCVYNLQTNNLSKKMIIGQMVQLNKSISYNNSRTNSYYITILSLDYDKNKQLLMELKYKVYIKYFNQFISCGKKNHAPFYTMIDFILSHLTPEEYIIVYEIPPPILPPPIIPINEVTKIFYISVFNSFFVLKNFINDYLIPSNVYRFNLEDPSNLNTKFCLSVYKNNVPVSGLNYYGIPGTPGSNVTFTVPYNIGYSLYVYNSLSLDPYLWGYGIIIPIKINPLYIVNSININIPVPNSFLSIYENNGPKIFISNETSLPFTGNINFNYAFYYGTYYIKVPTIFSIALLNNSQKNKIQYSGTPSKCITTDISYTTDDGTYNFYSDIVKISIYEEFFPISLYSYYYGYLGAFNSIIFDKSASNISQPEVRTDHVIHNNIETLYSQTRVGLKNNVLTLNNDVNYSSTSTKYGMYNGTYIFYTIFPITFLNKGKENLFVISGLNQFKGLGPDNTLYTFYTGIIQIKVLGNFNKMSIYTFFQNYSGGYYILNYGSQYNNMIPCSYSFTNETNLILNDPVIIIPTNQIPLNKYVGLIDSNSDSISISNFIRTGSSSKLNDINYITDDKVNYITIDNLQNIILNGIPYNNQTVYTMTKGIYLFFVTFYIGFMNHNKSTFNYDGYHGGLNMIQIVDLDLNQYSCFKSSYDGNIYYYPIVVNITGDFGYMSITTTSGYNGKNLLYYV